MQTTEEYWPLLTPDYELGCKVSGLSHQTCRVTAYLRVQRRVFDNDGYLACLQRPNVHVTDDPIVRFLEQSALTKSGRMYSVDVIVIESPFS